MRSDSGSDQPNYEGEIFPRSFSLIAGLCYMATSSSSARSRAKTSRKSPRARASTRRPSLLKQGNASARNKRRSRSKASAVVARSARDKRTSTLKARQNSGANGNGTKKGAAALAAKLKQLKLQGAKLLSQVKASVSAKKSGSAGNGADTPAPEMAAQEASAS